MLAELPSEAPTFFTSSPTAEPSFSKNSFMPSPVPEEARPEYLPPPSPPPPPPPPPPLPPFPNTWSLEMARAPDMACRRDTALRDASSSSPPKNVSLEIPFDLAYLEKAAPAGAADAEVEAEEAAAGCLAALEEPESP